MAGPDQDDVRHRSIPKAQDGGRSRGGASSAGGECHDDGAEARKLEADGGRAGHGGGTQISLRVMPPWALNVRVGANSPSLCPTMFSVTYTATNALPLCTLNV